MLNYCFHAIVLLVAQHPTIKTAFLTVQMENEINSKSLFINRSITTKIAIGCKNTLLLLKPQYHVLLLDVFTLIVVVGTQVLHYLQLPQSLNRSDVDAFGL